MTGPRPPEPVQLISVRAVVRLHEAGMSTAVGLPSNSALISFLTPLNVKTNNILS